MLLQSAEVNDISWELYPIIMGLDWQLHNDMPMFKIIEYSWNAYIRTSLYIIIS